MSFLKGPLPSRVGSRIQRDEVHVWLAPVDEALARRSEEELLSSLLPEDRDAVERARVPAVRRERIVARALLQRGLSWYLERPAGSWRISTSELGRPDLVPQDGQPDLRFNLSHSSGLVACGFALARALGVDVEHRERALTRLEEISRYLSPSERADWSAAPERERPDLFLRYWTLKEAYAKALGLGISMGFDRFSIELDEKGPKLRLEPSSPSDASSAWPSGDSDSAEATQSSWFLEQWMLPEHYLAAAVQREADAAIRFRLIHVTDLLTLPRL